MASDLPEYWKYYPAKWLLSDRVRTMSLVAIAGYRFLCDHAMLEWPPGILSTDHEKLRIWSRLNKREWARYSGAILANFECLTKKEGNGVSEWLCQPFIRQLFEATERQRWDSSAQARMAISKRWQKTALEDVKIRSYTSVYAPYTKKLVVELTSTPSPPTLRLAEDGSAGDEEEDGLSPIDHEDILKMKSILKRVR